MAMGQKNEGDESIIAEINMTPLIDIMLVLLIIFMVTSSVSLESGLDIDLPKTKTTQGPTQPQAIIVSLDRQGRVLVQGKDVTMDTLGKVLEDELKKTDSKLVILEGDRQSTLEKTMEIMDLAKKVGALKFAIATSQQE